MCVCVRERWGDGRWVDRHVVTERWYSCVSEREMLSKPQGTTVKVLMYYPQI